jgi:hypothetical protein
MASPYDIPFQTQLDWLWKELQGPEKATLDAFNSGQYITPQEYAKVFENLFERAGGKGMEKRQSYALDVFKGMDNNLKPTGEMPNNAALVYNYFLNKGMSPAQAAGITGNLMVESYPEINPSAFNPEGGGKGAFGIAQWRGPRLQGLLDFAGMSDAQPNNGTATAPKQGDLSAMLGMAKQAKGVGGLMEKLMQRDPNTGLNMVGRLGKGLDALVLKGYGQGEAIAQQGLARAAMMRNNRTAEYIRTLPGGTEYAEMIDRGLPASEVYAQYLKDRQEGIVGGGLGQTKFDNIMKINDKLRTNQAYKEAQVVRQGYENILYAFNNKSGVSDYALTIAFAKILDPGSVVREGEQAAIANTGGQINSWLSQTSNFFNGDGSLPDDVREQILNFATNNYNKAMSGAKDVYDEATNLATAAGLDTQYITKFDFTPLDELEAQRPSDPNILPPIPNGATVDGVPMTREQWKIVWDRADYAAKQQYYQTGQLPGAS